VKIAPGMMLGVSFFASVFFLHDRRLRLRHCCHRPPRQPFGKDCAAIIPPNTGFGQMAKTATRSRRKAPAKTKNKARSSGGVLSWAIVGVFVISGIAAYDNWKSIRPMISRLPAATAPTTEEAKPLAKKDAAPKQVALAAPAVKPVPPAPIPTPSAPPAKIETASVSPAVSETGSGAFGYCGQGEHINCVADGRTFWYKGEKIVIADILSPGIDAARCEDERKVAFAAKSRLLTLLNAGPFTMNAAGKADQGAAPRVVSRDGRSFGTQLVNEGLARKPGTASAAWCA
jgi:endonuclease YncB( thermonuclease family)